MNLRTVVASMAALALAPSAQAFELAGIDIHGFVSQGYLLSTDNEYLADDSSDGSFEYNEVGLNFGTDVTENLRIGVQLFSRDLGIWSNNELIVDWAFGDFHLADEFSLRAGKVKAAKGLYQEIQDFDFLRVWAILPTAVYDPGFRVFASSLYGAQAYGSFDLGGGGTLMYQLSLGGADIDGSQDVETLVTVDAFDTLEDAKVDWVLNAHLEYEPPVEGLRIVATYLHTEGLEVEVSGSPIVDLSGMGFGPFLPIGGTLELEGEQFSELNVGIEYAWRDWTFSAEYFRRFEKTKSTVRISTSVIEDELENESDGCYLGVGYRHDEHWSFGGYLSGYWSDVDDRDGDDRTEDYMAWRYDLALTVRYDVSEHWLIKAEAHLVNGVAGTFIYNESFADDDPEEDWQYFALKTTFNF